jgi:glutaredoxin 3
MKIKVYSTPGCPWCAKTKEFLKANKVAFEEINVAEDQKAAKDMIEKSGQQGVPVIEIGKEIIVGFDETKIKNLLKIK